MTAAATVAVARTVVAAAAVAVVALTLTCGAEIAQLAAQFGVEGLLERHVQHVARGCGRAGLGRGRTCADRSGNGTFTLRWTVTGRGRSVAGGREADLALVVDLLDPDLDLLTEAEHVFDGIDATPATELGDVDEPVTAREDVDERPELRDVDDAALVDLAELGLGRVDDGEDGGLGLLHSPRLDGADGDDTLHAVVVDADVSAGLGLDRVDDLALGSNDLADLVDRDVDRRDLRGRGGDLVARRADGGVHDLEDLETSDLRLLERGG